MRIDAEICQIRLRVEPSAIGITNKVTHFRNLCFYFFAEKNGLNSLKFSIRYDIF